MGKHLLFWLLATVLLFRHVQCRRDDELFEIEFKTPTQVPFDLPVSRPPGSNQSPFEPSWEWPLFDSMSKRETVSTAPIPSSSPPTPSRETTIPTSIDPESGLKQYPSREPDAPLRLSRAPTSSGIGGVAVGAPTTQPSKEATYIPSESLADVASSESETAFPSSKEPTTSNIAGKEMFEPTSGPTRESLDQPSQSGLKQYPSREPDAPLRLSRAPTSSGIGGLAVGAPSAQPSKEATYIPSESLADVASSEPETAFPSSKEPTTSNIAGKEMFEPTSGPTRESLEMPTTPPTTTMPVNLCEDSPKDWHDSDGLTYDCGWYAAGKRCHTYGRSFGNQGRNAQQACCVCGGGIEVTRFPSSPPKTTAPSVSATDQPTLSPTEKPRGSTLPRPHISLMFPTTSPSTPEEPTSPPVGPPLPGIDLLFPTMSPTESETFPPTLQPTTTAMPSPEPTSAPTYRFAINMIFPASYHPGNFSMNTTITDHYGRRLLLSNGLYGRPIAYQNEPVKFYGASRDGRSESSLPFHTMPDGAACFPSKRGGFYYTSNSEVVKRKGGVYSIEFDRDGQVIGYFNILKNTTRNCSGGRTPWGSWVSCEENGKKGHAFQCDPSGKMESKQTNVVATGGNYESFSYDIRNMSMPRFFTTEDSKKGALVRFTPDERGMACFNSTRDEDKWCTLDHGTHEYLKIFPSNKEGTSGTFKWLKQKRYANPQKYPLSEGLDVVNGFLYFTIKRERRLFILDLDNGNYTRHTTDSGAFDKNPDQICSIADDANDIIYFCEEGGKKSGLHGRDRTAKYFSILESPGYKSETTGLSFSPDAKFLFLAFQGEGVIWQFWRTDGRPFSGKVLDINYHAVPEMNRFLRYTS